MALTKAPKKPAPDAAAEFINRAPDATAGASTAPEASQNKKPITITFDPALPGPASTLRRSAWALVDLARWPLPCRGGWASSKG